MEYTHENQKICVSQECNGIGKIKGIANKSQGLDYRAQWLFSNPKSVGGILITHRDQLFNTSRSLDAFFLFISVVILLLPMINYCIVHRCII